MTAARWRITAFRLTIGLIASIWCGGCGVLIVRPVYEYYRVKEGLKDSWLGERDLDFVRGGIELAATLCPQLECFLFYFDSETGPGDSAWEVEGEFYGIGARSSDPVDREFSLDWALRLGHLDMEDEDRFLDSHHLATTSGFR